MTAPRSKWAAGTWLAASACIASNVVAPADRFVGTPAEPVFAPAPGDAVLEGLYESVDLRGDAAVSLRRIWYVFSRDGTYTAAALTDLDGVPTFQTLSGTWRCDAGGVSFDGAAPARLETAPDHLRVTAPTGVVVLARRSLQ